MNHPDPRAVQAAPYWLTIAAVSIAMWGVIGVFVAWVW